MSFFFHYTVSAVLIVKLLKQIFEIFETLLFLTLVAIPTRIPVDTHKIGDRWLIEPRFDQSIGDRSSR